MCPTCEATKKAMVNHGNKMPIDNLTKALAEGMGLKKYSTKCQTYEPKQGDFFEYETDAYGLIIVALNNSGDLIEVNSEAESIEFNVSEGAILEIRGLSKKINLQKSRKLNEAERLFLKTKNKSIIENFIRERHRKSTFKVSLFVKNKVAAFAIFEILEATK